MYLSKLTLNPRNRAVQRDLSRPHDLHKTIMAAFPDNLDKAQERVLFRVEQNASNQQISVLVQSQDQPDWAQMAFGYLLDLPNNPATKAVSLHLQSGQQLAFRLRANPTKRLSAGTGNKGKRIGIYKAEEQINWLQRKASDHGFAIHSVMPAQQQRIDARIPVKAGEAVATIAGEQNNGEEGSAGIPAKPHHDAKFFSVQFDGILQVTDPTAFLAAIQAGIGSGKAFGFGLLSVAPVG